MLCDIIDVLSFSLPFLRFLSSIEYLHCSKNVLNLSLHMIMLTFGYVYLWIYFPHVRENMFLCFWSWLLHLTLCPLIASIYLKITWNYSSWLSNIPACKDTTISWYSPQLLDTWVVSKAWLLWTVLWWTLLYWCRFCILPYITLGRCPVVVSMNNIAFTPLVFEESLYYFP
jgi:hypothetical protein